MVTAEDAPASAAKPAVGRDVLGGIEQIACRTRVNVPDANVFVNARAASDQQAATLARRLGSGVSDQVGTNGVTQLHGVHSRGRFDDHGGAHSSADTERRRPTASAARLQRVHERRQRFVHEDLTVHDVQHRPSGGQLFPVPELLQRVRVRQGLPVCDGPAVHDLANRQLHDLPALRSRDLVDLHDA